MTVETRNTPRPRGREHRVVVDSAGAIKGGAARYLRELRAYLAVSISPQTKLIGLDRQLTPRWLIEREIVTCSADLRVSLNNAGYSNPTGRNVTLLRNILQFANKADLEKLEFTPARRLKAQIPVVRALARASQSLIVPSTRMAEQVEMVTPHLREKLVVRFHPVGTPEWAGEAPVSPQDVLLPIVPSPYKKLDQHIAEFLKASDSLMAEPIRLVVPTTPDVFPEFASHPRVRFIGPQTSVQLEQWWRRSAAVFFPVEFESFGYALAEARVYGRHVIAQDFAHNYEIAGPALRAYRRSVEGSLRTAIGMGTEKVPDPDPGPFNPIAYFDWLFAKDGP